MDIKDAEKIAEIVKDYKNKSNKDLTKVLEFLNKSEIVVLCNNFYIIKIHFFNFVPKLSALPIYYHYKKK